MVTRRKLVTLLACLVGVAALAVPSAFAGGSGAQKINLMASTTYTCGGGTVPGSGPLLDSFAVLNQHGDTLSAEISIKKGIPNATYTIWVIQTPSGSDCGSPDTTLTTNGQGNGNVHWDEPIIAGSTGAWVAAFNSFSTGGFQYSAAVTFQ